MKFRLIILATIFASSAQACSSSSSKLNLANCPELLQNQVRPGKAQQVCSCLATDIAINPETKQMKNEISKAFSASKDSSELRNNLGLYTNSATTLGLIESCIYKSDAVKSVF